MSQTISKDSPIAFDVAGMARITPLSKSTIRKAIKNGELKVAESARA